MNIGDIYKQAVKITNTEIEYEFYRVIDWWNENKLKYVRIEKLKTGERFDIEESLLEHMQKVEEQ